MKINFTFLNIPRNTLKIADNNLQDTSQSNKTTSNNNQHFFTENNSTKTIQDVKINKITDFQKTLLIRDLLELPKEWNKLLPLLFSKNNSTTLNNLKQLIDLNQNLNEQVLKNFLIETSQNVSGKLLKIMSQYTENFKAVEQLKELLLTVNQIIPAKTATKEEALKDILLLYLPLCPINFDSKKLSEEMSQFEEHSKNNAEETIVYISTENLGQFLLSLQLNAENKIEIYLKNRNNEVDPLYLKNLSNDLKRKLNKANIKYELAMEVKQISKTNKELKRQFFIKQSPCQSSSLLIAIKNTLQIIFETDEKISTTN